MGWLEALLLGLVQGLTEFLPVSSSGHLEIGKSLLNVETSESLIFTVVVHGATVLSTIVIFRKELLILFKGLFQFKWNDETKYIALIVASMIPVGIVAVFFKDEIEAKFDGNIRFVGYMLLITASLLTFTYLFKPKGKKLRVWDALLMGIAQALAVLPGISRSGATISTGLILGNDRDETAKFSFLMVLIPILGANFLDLIGGEMSSNTSVGPLALIVGFSAAFISGLFACKWMINLVKKGNLIYFAIYCLLLGLTAIIFL